jgi:hypothetical protein
MRRKNEISASRQLPVAKSQPHDDVPLIYRDTK